MASAKQTITVALEKHDKLEATGITIPFDVEEVFGAKRVPIRATVSGAVYRGTIVRMGGKYMLGIPKAFRDQAGIKAGDKITVILEHDVTERTVELPDDLAGELKNNAKLKDSWDSLSFAIRKENVRALAEAKKPDTRARRLEKTVAMLKQKVGK